MTIALISLSRQGGLIAERLAQRMGGCEVYLHRDVRWPRRCHPQAYSLGGAQTQDTPKLRFAALEGGTRNTNLQGQDAHATHGRDAHATRQGRLDPRVHRFDRVLELTKKLFAAGDALVMILPTGVAVRAVAPCIQGKLTDPPVVVVDVGGRWAVSLLAGHEGGANELAMTVANILDAEPVITTTSEAARSVIAGVGCRRGTGAAAIVTAVRKTLAQGKVSVGELRMLASADIKSDEAGLLEAACRLHVPVRFISSDEIRRCRRSFTRSQFVQRKVSLPAVAEPAALLAGRRTQLLLPKQTYPGVTVALAKEDCWSLA